MSKIGRRNNKLLRCNGKLSRGCCGGCAFPLPQCLNFTTPQAVYRKNFGSSNIGFRFEMEVTSFEASVTAKRFRGTLGQTEQRLDLTVSVTQPIVFGCNIRWSGAGYGVPLFGVPENRLLLCNFATQSNPVDYTFFQTDINGQNPIEEAGQWAPSRRTFNFGNSARMVVGIGAIGDYVQYIGDTTSTPAQQMANLINLSMMAYNQRPFVQYAWPSAFSGGQAANILGQDQPQFDIPPTVPVLSTVQNALAGVADAAFGTMISRVQTSFSGTRSFNGFAPNGVPTYSAPPLFVSSAEPSYVKIDNGVTTGTGAFQGVRTTSNPAVLGPLTDYNYGFQYTRSETPTEVIVTASDTLFTKTGIVRSPTSGIRDAEYSHECTGQFVLRVIPEGEPCVA